MRGNKLIYVIMGILFILVLGACANNSTSETENELNEKMTITDDEGKEHEVEVSGDEDSIEITSESEDGEKDSFSYQTSGDIDFPDIYPDDIPLTDDALLEQRMSMQGMSLVTYVTNVDQDDVWDMYTNYFNNLDSEGVEVDEEIKKINILFEDYRLEFALSDNMWADQEDSDWYEYENFVSFTIFEDTEE